MLEIFICKTGIKVCDIGNLLTGVLGVSDHYYLQVTSNKHGLENRLECDLLKFVTNL